MQWFRRRHTDPPPVSEHDIAWVQRQLERQAEDITRLEQRTRLLREDMDALLTGEPAHAGGRHEHP